jgi:hypothetical protein
MSQFGKCASLADRLEGNRGKDELDGGPGPNGNDGGRESIDAHDPPRAGADSLREVRLDPLLTPALGDLHSGKFDLELRLSALVLLLLVLSAGFL